MEPPCAFPVKRDDTHSFSVRVQNETGNFLTLRAFVCLSCFYTVKGEYFLVKGEGGEGREREPRVHMLLLSRPCPSAY